MTKYLVLFAFGALVFEPTAQGQFGFAANIGASQGRRISEQMNTALRQGTKGFGGGGAKAGKGTGAGAKAQSNVAPPPAVPKPPPPVPLSRVITTQRKNTAPEWMKDPVPVGPPAPPPPPVNVDLAQIEKGMARETLLAFGKPSSKITLFEDGHMLEIYQYRNQTVASGTVRLRDGAVAAIEARP
ncbi:MAG: hypothetical protein ABIR70_21195 [Bryobacteraceae bacterium]